MGQGRYNMKKQMRLLSLALVVSFFVDLLFIKYISGYSELGFMKYVVQFIVALPIFFGLNRLLSK